MSKDDEFDYSLGGRFLAPLWRFLSRFVKDVNPTENWIRSPDVQMVLDLDKSTLAGIGMRVPHTRLSCLGPCGKFTRLICAGLVDDEGHEIDSKETKSFCFNYQADGIGFSADE